MLNNIALIDPAPADGLGWFDIYQIEKWERGQVPTVTDLFKPEIPSYEEAYTKGYFLEELEHLRSCDPFCFCPICEEERWYIEADLMAIVVGRY